MADKILPALTDLETKFVENMLTNDFGDIPDHHIWTDCWDCGKHGDFMKPSQIGGVMSSLVKKDVIGATVGDWDSFNHRSNNTCWLTETGQAVIARLVAGET